MGGALPNAPFEAAAAGNENCVLEYVGSWGGVAPSLSISMSSCRTGFFLPPKAPNCAVGAVCAGGGPANWNGADEEGGGPAGVVEGAAPNVNGFAGVAAVALWLLNESPVEVPFAAIPGLVANGLLIGCTPVTPGRVKVKEPVAGAAGVEALESGLGFEPGGAPNANGFVGAGVDVNGKPGTGSALIGLLSASLGVPPVGALNVNGLFVGVTVPGVPLNSVGGVSAGVVEARAMNGKPGLLSGEVVAAAAVVLGAAAGAA